MDRNQLACVAEQNSVKSVNLKHQNGNLKNRILAEDPKNMKNIILYLEDKSFHKIKLFYSYNLKMKKILNHYCDSFCFEKTF